MGVLGNYSRRAGRSDGTGQVWLVLMMILWAFVAAVMVYSVVRQQCRPGTYGFSFKRGGVVSLGIVAAIQVFLAVRDGFGLSAGGSLLFIALGAFMEELVFRAIAIDKLMLLMNGIRARAFWSILASSVVFLLPHIPSKSPVQLQGIFISALIFGVVYYKSGSILLPAWYHGISNAGFSGGILIAVVYCLISLADWAIWSRSSSLAATSR